MIANPDDSSCQHLISAYCSTLYQVVLNHGIMDVQIGQTHPGLDRLVEADHWHIITAFNPGSQRLSAAANRQRQAQLLDGVINAGLSSWPTRHLDPAGQWETEHGLLIAGCEQDWIHHQALRFGQLAIVSARIAQPAELWLYGDPEAEYEMPHLRVFPR